MTSIGFQLRAALLLAALMLSSCRSPQSAASRPPLPPPTLERAAPAQRSEIVSTEQFLRPQQEFRPLPGVQVSPLPQWVYRENLNVPRLRAPSWTEPILTGGQPQLLLEESPPVPDFFPPTARSLPIQVRFQETPSLPQPDLQIALTTPLTPESLRFRPDGGKLRPRSPYCMPGHTSQNFVVYSAHDGLPLHPGVW